MAEWWLGRPPPTSVGTSLTQHSVHCTVQLYLSFLVDLLSTSVFLLASTLRFSYKSLPSYTQHSVIIAVFHLSPTSVSLALPASTLGPRGLMDSHTHKLVRSLLALFTDWLCMHHEVAGSHSEHEGDPL